METSVQMTKGGRLVVPAKFRKALDIKTGDELILRLEDGSIRMIPLKQAVSQAQELVRKYAENLSLVDELIQARRSEAKHE